MNTYIELTNEPTKEQYFEARLCGIPFAISDPMDIIEFNLIDYDRLYDMNIEHDGLDMLYIHTLYFKHDIKVRIVPNSSQPLNRCLSMNVLLSDGRRLHSTNHEYLVKHNYDHHITGLNMITVWFKNKYSDLYKLLMRAEYERFYYFKQ